ncbi:MAG: 2-dehydro-3-deoxygalactonokinase, partial [Acetobacteraceae bacterium]
MIGVDWGTSSFRAYRLDRDGRVLNRSAAPLGIMAVPEGAVPEGAVPEGRFDAALRQAVGPWLAEGERRVLLCGMVGSRQGWVEAPYLGCPAGPV